MSLRLACTVRGCGAPLAREGERLGCGSGHAFDRAREGYWNLAQPQDKRSTVAGDRAEALLARRRFLARGHADELIGKLRGALLAHSPGELPAVDVSCGEGTITRGILAGRPGAACGVDLSVRAVRMAARLEPGITWLVANADRRLPFEDGSVGVALSIFGRRPVAELGRILPPGAILIAVLPGPEDLVELREAAQGRGELRERAPRALEELAAIAAPVESSRWKRRARLDRDALADALAMSYRGERAGERRRISGLDGLDVTLDAEILVLRRT